MATITLYKDKLNGVGGLIDNIIKSSNSLDTQLGTLKSTLQGVSNSTYNLQDTVNSISSSSKTEKEKVSDLTKNIDISRKMGNRCSGVQRRCFCYNSISSVRILQSRLPNRIVVIR